MPSTKILGILDLESANSSYYETRDRNRNGQQHIEALALIFSGSFNNGKYYIDEDKFPFLLQFDGDHNAEPDAIPGLMIFLR